MVTHRRFFGTVDLTAVGEAVEETVARELHLRSCDSVHPEHAVHHPGGHRQSGLLS